MIYFFEIFKNLANEIEGEGKIISHHCDLCDENSILETFNWIHTTYGEINILICNAGVNKANFLTGKSIL